MPAVQNSLEGTIALAVSYWGTRWPNPWWPGQDNDANDCAAFMSWILFGLAPGGGPRYIWVSDLQLRVGWQARYDLENIRRGDIIGWNWSGGSPGSYDHTGICTRVVGDTVYTVDANSGPGDQVGEYGRSKRFITSFVRPPYPGTAGAGGSGTPIEIERDEIMQVLITGNQSKHTYFCIYDPLFNQRSRKLEATQVSLIGYTNIARVEMEQASFDAIPYGLEDTLRGSAKLSDADRKAIVDDLIKRLPKPELPEIKLPEIKLPQSERELIGAEVIRQQKLPGN